MDKPTRQGQEHKRLAILEAARDLFLELGVERTSMDAISARAGVSKRTVYDYYGDKRRLLLGVVERAGETALGALSGLVQEHLADEAVAANPSGFAGAVTGFATDLGASLIASTDYTAAVRLIAENESLLPELENHPLDEAHSQVLAERFAHFAAAGLLRGDDPRLAADHFNALTTLRVLNEPLRLRGNPERVRQIMTDGTEAFVRAYALGGPVSP
ncbi:TetR/AcrR family transcriptional regulator [Plantibacter sp. MCCC 1A11337]|uniref:TetR/AcrR family transcriptional regulator n=1 Tax=Plantibacter TaxID=190323 RepID=UPI000F10A03D|nr:TetR/AcrR family transcriptional regulator [Plantibacter sp. MCCC 1A11337]NUJ88490.1 TetR/AcrR family transcriptional regulator [Plantibacter sp. MCCC 1A11337]